MEPGFEINHNCSVSTFDLGDEKTNGNTGIFITRRKFVERHLFIEDKDFLISPNGGTGDCCFKAIAQAIEGSEVDHHKIREEVVNFVVNQRWDKLKESIEVQHIHGNQFLQKTWISDPVITYQNYMTTNGTLGSSTELNAAGELFRFNFVTIQEYSDSDKKSYRVEICSPFDDSCVPIHYFYFTGDFDNGHWEYLEPLSGYSTNVKTISDGMYPGLVKVFIEGLETTVEEWLKIHTHNTNDEFTMKHTLSRYPSVKSPYPFESDDYSYMANGSVLLKGHPYRVSNLDGTDLFTVLFALIFPEADQTDATLVDKLEEQIITYRVENTALLNYKLITQPHSHGFDIGTLKFVGMTCKGNVQDLLAAADLFGFSFEIFIKPEQNDPIRSCRFVHVDRWGGETDRVLHFVMRLSPRKGPLPLAQDLLAKWWHVAQKSGSSRASPQISNNNLHLNGDIITVAGDQNYDALRRKSSTKSCRRHSSKQEMSVCGSGEHVTKNSAKINKKVSSNYDLAPKDEHSGDDDASIKTHFGKTESDSDSSSNDLSEQSKHDKNKAAGKNQITNHSPKTPSKDSVKRNHRSSYSTSSKSTSRSTSRNRRRTKDAISCQKPINENSNNDNHHFAKDNFDNNANRNDFQSDNSRPDEENYEKLSRDEDRQSHYTHCIIANIPEMDKTPQFQTSQSDPAVMHKRSKKGKYTGNPSTMPKVETQVFIYDGSTNKTREYRFEGVKSREKVLTKLLKLGYIKRIPILNSTAEKLKSQKTIEQLLGPRRADRVELSETCISEQTPVKQRRSAAEKYRTEPSTKKVGSKWSFNFNGIRRHFSPLPSDNTREASSENRVERITSKFIPHEISSQNVSNQNYIQHTLRAAKGQEGLKKSWENLQLPRPRSASVLALVDQDSVEHRNTILAKHQKTSPWVKRKAERIDKPNDSRQRNLFERFVDWVTSFFESCKKMKVASVKENALLHKRNK